MGGNMVGSCVPSQQGQDAVDVTAVVVVVVVSLVEFAVEVVVVVVVSTIIGAVVFFKSYASHADLGRDPGRSWWAVFARTTISRTQS